MHPRTPAGGALLKDLRQRLAGVYGSMPDALRGALAATLDGAPGDAKQPLRDELGLVRGVSELACVDFYIDSLF